MFWKRCAHANVRCVHGDEIIQRGYKRRACRDCGRSLEGTLPEPCTVTGQPHEAPKWRVSDMSIQRWSIAEIGTLNGVKYEMHPFNNGGYVLYADAVKWRDAAVAEAEQRTYDDRNVYSEAEVEEQNTKHYDKGRREGYEQGQKDAQRMDTAEYGQMRYEQGVIAGAAEGVKAGRSGALADAVAAVEALPFDFPLDDVHRGRIHKAAAIAAIKGVGK